MMFLLYEYVTPFIQGEHFQYSLKLFSLYLMTFFIEFKTKFCATQQTCLNGILITMKWGCMRVCQLINIEIKRQTVFLLNIAINSFEIYF